MDTLLVPLDATLAPKRARYVCNEPWDGGTYFTYARRQGRMRVVPERLRQYMGSAKNDDEDDEFTEHILPTPQPEQEAFLQTWLFFGLLAEFFGLNEDHAGQRLVDAETAKREIAALYDDYVEDDGGESDTKYLTGAHMLKSKDAPLLIVTRLRLAGSAIKQRIQYLHRCLNFSCFLLSSAIHADFDPAIKTSIAALGELLSTGFATASNIKRIPSAGVSFSFAWADRYLEAGGDLEQHMIAHGWCISEVEKIRSVNQGLGTRHYLSHMHKGGPRHDHSLCSKEGCVAFQIDPSSYRPSHASNDCGCELVPVDVPRVMDVLQHTSGYPVLTISSADDEHHSGLEIDVEAYSEDVPYVAISHVWADGMGNPTANSLPACQIAKVARLVSQLQAATDSSPSESYRVWIDPLLCPIDEDGKNLALQRIPDVYRNATHVLVLDASLMEFAAKELPPEEILLRIFSSSAWIRRLWTLQEGALARSLYFQFSDSAVSPTDEMTKLYMKGLSDARYMRLWQDIAIEQVHLRGWFQSMESLSTPSSSSTFSPSTSSSLSLVSLQRALHFRTVSNPDDEPLCIATLLCLDQTYVVAAPTLEERMARVWELIAKKLGGSVPARILFSSDETLGIPGWRWALRSLLSASDAAKHSGMDVHHRIMRFRDWRSDHLEEGTTEAASITNTGVPTPWGLRVKMSGFSLKSVPLLPNLPLHPWERVTGSHEDMILVKHSESGRWLRIMDFYRLEMSKKWSPTERREYDQKTDNPLCRLVDGGHQAVIYDRPPAKGQYFPSLMVRQGDRYGTEGVFRAQRERVVVLDWASPAHATVADGLHELAMEVAKDDTTEQYLDVMNSSSGWDEAKDAKDKVRDCMKAAMAKKWTTDPAFVEAVRDTRGPNMENVMWAEIQMRFSHNIICTDTPDTQIWLID